MTDAVLTVDQMRAAEQASMDSGTSEWELMQRAGNAVAEFLHANWPEGRIQVLCGPGGNGGDGFVAASQLAKLWRDVDVFCQHLIQHGKADTWGTSMCTKRMCVYTHISCALGGCEYIHIYYGTGRTVNIYTYIMCTNRM